MKEYKYKINGNVYKVIINDIQDNIANVEVNGSAYKVELEEAIKTVKPKIIIQPTVTAPAAPVQPAAQVARPAPASGGGTGVKSPLPGVILELKVNVGDVVTKGQTVLILEAMKMENNINADRDGKVVAINVNKGDSVLEGTDLIIIE